MQREYDQQSEKANGLADRIKLLEENNRGASEEADKYRATLNRTKAAMIELEREIQDNNRYLDEARQSADGAAISIDKFGDAVKDADGAEGKGGLKSLIGSLGNLKNFIVGGAVVGGIKEVTEAIFEITDATKEYRQIMGSLEVSSQQAGYTTEQTAEAYERLYGVLGDTQTAATTVANLQAIGLEQDRLMQLVDAATGAWSRYGDSIPIDGLSESINETIKVGQVTGVFADVLNWAGINEDEFNEKLQQTSSDARRADLLLHTLAEQGLVAAGQGWRDVNADIVSANESQMEWEQSMGELGEFLQPAANALRSFGADAIGYVTDMLKDAVGWIKEAIDWIDNLNNKLVSRGQQRMESYGYEAYYTDDGLLRYRQAEVSDQLATASVTEPRSGASDAVLAEAASALNALRAERSAQGGGHFTATVTLATEDGRNLGQFVTPFVNEENAANPPVRSDDV